jgi:amino acid transporter
MTLFTVSAIVLLDTLAASASAELGTTYPEQGGIYAWVRDAFGPRWGTRVTWLYWLNTTIWNASIFVLFAGVFAQMFFPDLSLGAKLAIAIGVNWLVVLVTTFSLSVGKWIRLHSAAIRSSPTTSHCGLSYRSGARVPSTSRRSSTACSDSS